MIVCLKQENWLLLFKYVLIKNKQNIYDSEISDEEVDYGSYASNVDLDIAPDSSWSPL
jgi:hypothetical protein